MRYKLLKDWQDENGGRIIKAGVYIAPTTESKLKALIDGGYIEAPKKEKKKTKKIKIEENGGTDFTTNN